MSKNETFTYYGCGPTVQDAIDALVAVEECRIEKQNHDGSWEIVLAHRADRALAQKLAERAVARGNVMRLVESSTGKVLWSAP